MVKCDNCNKELGFFDTKYNFKDIDGNFYKLCFDCNKKLTIEKEKTLDKIKKSKIKKLKLLEQKKQKINYKWEYLVKKINTGFGGSVKTRDDELNELGSKGWELVNVALVNQANMFTGQIVTAVMTFKRRIL